MPLNWDITHHNFKKRIGQSKILFSIILHFDYFELAIRHLANPCYTMLKEEMNTSIWNLKKRVTKIMASAMTLLIARLIFDLNMVRFERLQFL
jgi:hypothetical protein